MYPPCGETLFQLQRRGHECSALESSTERPSMSRNTTTIVGGTDHEHQQRGQSLDGLDGDQGQEIRADEHMSGEPAN